MLACGYYKQCNRSAIQETRSTYKITSARLFIKDHWLTSSARVGVLYSFLSVFSERRSTRSQSFRFTKPRAPTTGTSLVKSHSGPSAFSSQRRHEDRRRESRPALNSYSSGRNIQIIYLNAIITVYPSHHHRKQLFLLIKGRTDSYFDV